jgi:hypothetical protein
MRTPTYLPAVHLSWDKKNPLDQEGLKSNDQFPLNSFKFTIHTADIYLRDILSIAINILWYQPQCKNLSNMPTSLYFVLEIFFLHCYHNITLLG